MNEREKSFHNSIRRASYHGRAERWKSCCPQSIRLDLLYNDPVSLECTIVHDTC